MSQRSLLFFLLLCSLYIPNAVESKSFGTLQLICGPSLSALLPSSWPLSTSECNVSIGSPQGSRGFIISLLTIGDNYGMSGGSPRLMDKAICGVFLSLLAQLELKRQEGRRPCDTLRWVTLLSSHRMEMQSSPPAVSGDGC